MDRDQVVNRRLLLRGGLIAGAGAGLAALSACSADRRLPGPSPSGTEQAGSGDGTIRHRVPDQVNPIPRSFTTPADEPGRLVELVYDTYESQTYEQRTRRLRKRAIVYLPSDYDDGTAHDVFYLMHGGWGDETTTLGTPDAPSTFKNVLDNAIAAGEIDPLIVVCPTYNNTSPDDSADFSLALTLTENYRNELLNDLIPAVEDRYSTYAERVSSTGLEESRDHRGFGGFSMGAVTTWRTFRYCLDFFRHFLPMSCGTSLDMDDIVAAARTRNPSDYFVAVITGSEDFAHPEEESRVAFLRQTLQFTDSDDEAGGNFVYRVKDGYGHDEVAAMEYTYNGLRWFRDQPR